MKLKVLTWNISYAYGIGSAGTRDYQPKSRSAYEASLNKMSEVIMAENPDVVMLQEVDFDSARSHHIHQLDFISRKTNLLHRQQIISWDVPYVPFPGLTPRRHFGKVVSGGGILSKHPLVRVQFDLLPKPRAYPRIVNYFYLYRYLQIVRVNFSEGSQPLAMMNLHLEAFNQENRELHLIKLQDRMRDYGVDLACGDFNQNLATVKLDKSLAAYPAPKPTFPSDHPKETFDGFVIRPDNIKVLSTQVLQSAGAVSDHLPLFIEIEATS